MFKFIPFAKLDVGEFNIFKRQKTANNWFLCSALYALIHSIEMKEYHHSTRYKNCL